MGNKKRTEATILQWKQLYEVATRIKEMKPWDYLWDLDLIGIQTGDDPRNTVFYSVLGRGGTCLGISIYEGYEGLNTFMMLTMQESMNLSVEYAMFNQKNLTCYWGNREELSANQRKIIKELGYKYRGKNNWLYFLSFEPGYYPYNLNQDEVLRFTQHLENLELAFSYYIDLGVEVDFEHGEMFSFVFSEDRKKWHFGAEPMPFTSYKFGILNIEEDELTDALRQVPIGDMVLELDLIPLGAGVTDKKYEKPANPMMIVIMERQSGMVLACEMSTPEDDPLVVLAEKLLDLIFQYGVPKIVYVRNVIVEAVIEQICDLSGTQLKKVKRLRNVDEFMDSMRGFSV